jgi:pathogenesis-related protein 1
MKKKQWLIRAGYALLASCLAACVQTSTANSTSPTSGSSGMDASAMIAAHNEWRSKVGVPGLQWSDKLAGVAQKWADHLAGTTCSLGHSGNEYGENIYWASSIMHSDGSKELSPKTPKDAVDSWGNEVQWYDHSDNSCHMECGHYTQVVWQETKEVGCAMAVCGDNSQIWVCNYFPAGNMVGKKPY